MKITFTIETTDLTDAIEAPDALIGLAMESLDPGGQRLTLDDGEALRAADDIADRAGEFVRAEVLKYLTMVDNSDFDRP